MSEPPDERPPDLEIGGGWSAERAKWSRQATVRKGLTGQPDTEELNEKEGLPDRPAKGRSHQNVARRWRLSAWIRER
ncbi:MAG TPA: hypothetical protein VGF25_07290 [Thermoleophilaceae bacterium]